MKIRVLNHDNDKIYFSTVCGEGFGLWKDKEKPLEKDYSVEFLVNKPISSHQIKLSEEKIPRIQKINDGMLFVGKVIFYNEEYKNITMDMEDGYIDFAVNDDINVNEIYGKYVEIFVENVGIYDEGY